MMRINRLDFLGGRMLPFAIALSIVAGCAASDKGPKYADANAFCNGKAEAECNGEVTKACAIADATHCIAGRQQACIAAMPPGTTYSPGAAESCVNSVSAAFGDAKVTAEENVAVSTACTLVFDGPGVENAACKADGDCNMSAGLRCVRTGGLATGTCHVPQPVQGGGSCSAPSQRCVDGFHCGASQHCDLDGQENETCTDATPCASTTRCVSGMCAKKSDDGVTCATDEECLHAICLRGAGDPQGLCAAQLTLAPNEPFCRDAR